MLLSFTSTGKRETVECMPGRGRKQFEVTEQIVLIVKRQVQHFVAGHEMEPEQFAYCSVMGHLLEMGISFLNLFL